MAKKPVTKDSAFERLAALCSRSEQCESDLMKKMVAWGLRDIERREVAERLKEGRFLDESRFAKAFATDKARFSVWGPVKIRIELAKRRIPGTIIRDAVAGVNPDIWKEGLLKCARTKSRTLELNGTEGYKNQQKLYAYLISRGFPSGASSKAVALMKKEQMKDEMD
ncbi:MAG: RecX family transcriptional regulator [Muribaculaceae bacterium]|nr:RecX family transcriptional regulator [Muribaculaceae bacterium]